MTIDYDLAIIGDSPAGVHAAIAAAQLKARVALVAPQLTLTGGGLSGVPFVGTRPLAGGVIEWANGVFPTGAEKYSPTVLASLGIDAIAGEGQFGKPRRGKVSVLAFQVGDRLLRSRAYLLAPDSRPVIPDIPGLEDTGYLTRETILRLSSEQLPQTCIVLGADPSGIELAIALTRWGTRVTLIVARPHILHQEDPEAAQLIQAQLEALGVRILTQTKVTKVKQNPGKKWVQAGDRTIEADEILLACGRQPNIASLNLETVGVKWQGRHLYLNNKLQTTNSRIYGCGDVGGGYQLTHIANYQASIALKNALFLPLYKVDYRAIPRAIFTEPQLAGVGLTEPQAIHQYGADVLVLRQYFKSVAGAHIRGETTGFCKIIVRRSGEILGAHIVGPDAAELIHTFALAMQNRLKVGAIAQVPHIWPTLSEINSQTAQLWNQQRFRNNSLLQNFLETLFIWRRS